MKKILLFLGILLIILSGCLKNNYDNGKHNTNYFDYENDIKAESYSNTYEESDYSKSNSIEKRKLISVKYRDSLLDVSDFLTTNTSDSSFIYNAYYDPDNEYLILNLNGTYYHWCDVPSNIRNEFKNADSKGSYYNKFIKGEYDCRYTVVPSYD